MTGTIITASATVLAAIATVLLGYFVRRTDRTAKATRANMKDQQYTMRLVGTIRDDYWGLAGWAYPARELYNMLRTRWNAQHPDDVAPALGNIPTPLHRRLEERHAAGTDDDEDE